MLKTSETVREFMEGFYAKDRSAARRFEQKVREILKKLKEVFDTLLGTKAYSEEARMLYKAGSERVAEIQKLFDKGVLAMREGNLARNYEVAKDSTSNQGSDVQYSFRKYTAQQKENWKNAKRIVIYESESQFKEFVKTSRNDKSYNKKCILVQFLLNWQH